MLLSIKTETCSCQCFFTVCPTLERLNITMENTSSHKRCGSSGLAVVPMQGYFLMPLRWLPYIALTARGLMRITFSKHSAICFGSPSDPSETRLGSRALISPHALDQRLGLSKHSRGQRLGFFLFPEMAVIAVTGSGGSSGATALRPSRNLKFITLSIFFQKSADTYFVAISAGLSAPLTFTKSICP